MTEAPPLGKAKGSVSHHSDEALDITPRQAHRQTGLATEEIGPATEQVNAPVASQAKNLRRHLCGTWPARLKAAIAAERSMPKMHWRWHRRGRNVVALLQSRFGSALPDDDAGTDAAELLAQHYMRLNIDAERATRANLRLWAPWATEKMVARLIRTAEKSKTPSAAQLGKDFRVTVEEVADLGLTAVTAFTVTLGRPPARPRFLVRLG